MIKRLIYRGAAVCASVLALSASAHAESILLEETFNGDYSGNFPTVFDGDSKMPASAIQSFFLSPQTGSYMPWWKLAESSTAADKFIGSHSWYSPAGTSDDWLISRPITIPAEQGYVLEFDAQSVVLRSGSRLSDLWVFVTSEPRSKSTTFTPDQAVAHFEQIPAGESLDVTTGEWVRYTVNLDAFAGQTVYVQFANLNSDKDLLVLDNVKVYLPEAATLAFEAPEYVIGESADVRLTIEVDRATPLGNVTVQFSDGTETALGDLPAGESCDLDHTFTIAEPASTLWCGATVTADGYTKSIGSDVTRLGFETTRRVLLEESTGLWCSNCPLGMYNIESLMADEDYNEQIIPVSVHISGAQPDMMAMDDYADYLGLTGIAPVVRINRYNAVAGFSGYDMSYNPTNENTFAYRVIQETRNPALMDIDLSADWVIQGTDTVAIAATATVRPALNFDEPSRYRVGFVLTENNVGLDNHPFWIQQNGVSGYPYPSKLGGWTELPAQVLNLRYHYVARANSPYSGLTRSFSELVPGGEYTVDYTMAIPDTYESRAGLGVVSPAIRREYCELTAYIVDTYDLHIVNAVRVPMSDVARNLYTVEDLLADLSGVENIAVDGTAEPLYYNLQGVRVAEPSAPGVYITSDGRKVLRR